MGTYYDVKDVEEKGKRLNVYPHSKYPKDLRLQSRLVAVCDRLVYKLAWDVTDPDEYENCYAQYLSGGFVSHDLYDYCPPAFTTF